MENPSRLLDRLKSRSAGRRRWQRMVRGFGRMKIEIPIPPGQDCGEYTNKFHYLTTLK